MTFPEVVDLLASTGNAPRLLRHSANSAAVAVAPELVGRVMCSTFDSNAGEINSWINRQAIQKGKVDPIFNNFGGEERFWLGPEGGPFGLMFGRKESSFENYLVQEGMSSHSYRVLGGDERSISLATEMTLRNASETEFSLRVERRISLIESCPYLSEIPRAVELVAFQSENVVTNVGRSPWGRKGGALAIWCLGQFAERPQLCVIVPVRPVVDSAPVPPTVDEYFKDFCLGGSLPSGRRLNLDECVLLKADGKVRGKIGVKRSRAMGRLGSYDPNNDHLIIVDHDFYPELDYATGYWRAYDNAFDGDALSVYIDGPEGVGGPDGLSYELETMSPALFLRPRESFAYRNRTFHLRGSRESIGVACKRFLKVDIAEMNVIYRMGG
jgi:hypothetical protein